MTSIRMKDQDINTQNSDLENDNITDESIFSINISKLNKK